MAALFFSEDAVDEGSDVAHVHRVVAVEVGIVGHRRFAQNHIDEGCDVAHVDSAIAVEVAGEVFFYEVFESIPRYNCFIGFHAAFGNVEGAR